VTLRDQRDLTHGDSNRFRASATNEEFPERSLPYCIEPILTREGRLDDE